MINKKRLSLFTFALSLLMLFSNLNAQLLSAPTTTTEYYSRDTLVRSIIKGGEFTTRLTPTTTSLVTRTHPLITAHDYFGIVEKDAKAYRIDRACDEALDRATSIDANAEDRNIAGACTEVTDRFGDEPTSNTNVTYAWAQVDNGILTSEVLRLSVRVVPEINFTGQSSYVYDPEALNAAVCITFNMLLGRDRDCGMDIIATDINVEAYLGRDTNISDNIFNNMRLNKFIEGGIENRDDFSENFEPTTANGVITTTTNGVIKYNIPLGNIISQLLERREVVMNRGGIPDNFAFDTNNVLRTRRGATLVALLDRGRDMTDLYELAELVESGPREGGFSDISSIDYLVGPNNVVKIKNSDDPFIRMRNIYLFECREDECREGDLSNMSLTQPVITVNEGKTYYMIASYLTYDNTTNPIVVRHMPTEGAGYDIVELSTQTTATLLEEAEEFDPLISDIPGPNTYNPSPLHTAIMFKVTTMTGTVTVGWDSIGNLEDVKSTYQVTTASYVIENDIDGDRISDEIERRSPSFVIEPRFNTTGVNTSLFVDVRANTDTVHLLTTDNSDNYVYVSDAGLILATGFGMGSTLSLSDFSPANIAYSSIDSTTKEPLEYNEGNFMGDTPIETIATFAARSIPYSIPPTEGGQAGGLVRTVFPMESSLRGQILYLSRYNTTTTNMFRGWQNFERNTEDPDAETWYAIDWPSGRRCPTSVELYKYEHNIATADGQADGFIASDHNCIMVVTKDGSSYDNSIDGSVSEQIAVGRQRFVDEEIEIESMQCTAFYPHIGQTELFFQIQTSADVADINRLESELMRNSRLELMQNGSTLTHIVKSVSSETPPSIVGFILTAELESAITSRLDITATYTHTQGGDPVQCMGGPIMASLDANADGDTITLPDGRVVGLPDIVDNAPFDDTNNELNPTLTSTTPSQITTSTRYFSRDTLVRSLLSGEGFQAFSYVYEENDRLLQEDFENAMSEADYFGVSVSDDARVFKLLGECGRVLRAAGDYNLNMVQILEFCTEDEDVTGELRNEDPGSDEYVWVELDDNRLASKSDIYEVEVLPEFNFVSAGESPILLSELATTITRILSDISRETTPGNVELRRDTGEPISIPVEGEMWAYDPNARRHITPYTASSGAAGTTVIYWLSGPSSVWTPTTPSSVLQPIEGGHPSINDRNFMSAVGPMNRIDIIGQAATIECAAFYPNIGQTQLFFQIETSTDVDLSGLELMQDSNALPVVQRETTRSEVGFTLKATLQNPITSDSPITATYTQGGNPVLCMASLDEDSDDDNLPDIVDNTPFDDTNNELNPTLTSTTPSQITTSTRYFSRDTLVRSLLSGEGFRAFSYVYEENDRLVQEDFENAMSEADYFGVNVSDDARVFKLLGECGRVLRATGNYNLNRVQILEFCTEDEDVTGELRNEAPSTNNYVWVELDGNRLASKSDIYEVEVLPEFNFVSAGESPILLSELATTITRILSDISRETTPGNVELRQDTGEPISIPVEGEMWAYDPNARRHITPYTASSGAAGTTVIYWLSGPSSVWTPTTPSSVLQPIEGGHPSINDRNFMSAVGPMNHIDIIGQAATIECAAFYPNIGQTQLFFQIETSTDVDLSGLELMQDSNALPVVQRETTRSEVGFTLKATLQNPITSDSPITATYTQGGNPVLCMASLDEDSDDDNLPDIVDNTPFDDTNNELNPTLTSTTPSQITTSTRYFSRDTLVRSLLSGEGFRAFSYVYEENDRLVQEDFENAMSEADYFGVNVSDDARVFKLLGECGRVLRAAEDYNLNMVQILEFCTEDEDVTGELRNEAPSTNNYVWVELDGNRLASKSDIYEVEVLPEFNFVSAGESPILLSELATTITRILSDISRETTPGNVELRRDTGEPISIPVEGEMWAYDPNARRHITPYTASSGAAGTTVIYWLSGPSSVWTPTTPSSVLQPIEGGHPSINDRNFMSAVGPMNHIDIIGQAATIECAAFYPNIGQTQLFFQIETSTDVDLSGLELMQNGNALPVVQRETTRSEVGFTLKATLQNPIISASPIMATYRQGGNPVPCMASLNEDFDDDNLPDIVDNTPFDDTDGELNPTLTGPPSQITTSTRYFSRDTLVRHLLSGEGFEEFSYAYIDDKNDNDRENDELIREDFTSEDAISEADYFGVSVSGDARVFKLLGECGAVLRAAEDYNLNRVQILEFCTEDEDVTGELRNEDPGSSEYVWVELDGNRLASKSDIYEVEVLPEFNFGRIAENSPIVYAVPTTTPFVIIREDSPGMQSDNVELRRDIGETISISLEDDGTATYDAPSGAAGTTVTYWLSGPSSSVWTPRGNELETRSGGNDIARFISAVGPMSRIDIIVEVTTVTYINQILLYEVDDSRITLRPSMIAGRNYYIVAEYTTNKPSIPIIPITPSNMIMDNATTATLIRDAGHLKGRASRIAIIQVSAEELGTETEKTQTEGWDRIGRIENVEATYLVTSAGARPPIYNSYADIDRDRIDNTLDSSDPVTRLPVIIDGRVRDVNILQTSEGYPLFMSDVGILIALGKGSNEEDYSAANIKDNEIDQTTRDFLGPNFSEEPSLIETIATFGVETGAHSGDRGMVASITFPVESSEGIKQIRRYNRNMNSWEEFRRTTTGHPDTWYAIARTDTNAICEDDDEEEYEERHGEASNSGQNCIMLVISDGGPYDNSGLDGRIIGLFSLGPPPMMQPPPPTMPDTPPSSRRGSAVSVGDILLFISALALLIGAANQRRRRRNVV